MFAAHIRRPLVIWTALMWIGAVSAIADDAYFNLPITQKLTPVPDATGSKVWNRFGWAGGLRDFPLQVKLDEGEGFVVADANAFWSLDSIRLNGRLAARVPQGKAVKGTVCYPTATNDRFAMFSFEIPASEGRDSPEARAEFFRAKASHYQALMSIDRPGAAWFRHQATEALREAGADPRAIEQRNAGWRARLRMNDTFDLFSGGRAISENLQLDRQLAPAAQGDQGTVEVAKLRGITVREFDWSALIKDKRPAFDPLARLIPADQHVIFFPSFQAMLEVMDEADQFGTPVLEAASSRVEDTQMSKRYQRQLCLEASTVARLLGPAVVSSVAMTGSDPYLPTGSDLAILFEAKSPAVLIEHVRARQAAAKSSERAEEVKGTVAGVDYMGVRTADNRVRSFVATIGNAVVVTNSIVQIEAVANAGSGTRPNVTGVPEYTFFRDRYRLGQSRELAQAAGESGESALVIISDLTIRRWCGPKWRIGSSRRTRAMAALTELLAANQDSIVQGKVDRDGITLQVPDSELGQVTLKPSGIHSSIYGSLEFQTPISELPLELATSAEASAYEVWRAGYEGNWRQAFDPIAIRLSVGNNRAAADLTVVPLILGTQYRQLIDFTQGASIPADAGDRHPEAIGHIVLAINPQSRILQFARGFLEGRLPLALRADPFAWLGKTISLYFDDDPFWSELAKHQDWDSRNRFLQEKGNSFPAALRIDATNSGKLALFLAALRTFIEQTAPNVTDWRGREYKDRKYMQITERVMNRPNPFSLYYTVVDNAIIFTPSEKMIHRAIEREIERAKRSGKAPDGEGTRSVIATGGNGTRSLPTAGWLGENAAMELSPGAWLALEGLFHNDFFDAVRRNCFNSLPILNEWKRRYPNLDPVEVHEKVWGARLICPGGGKFVWNADWQTMESMVFGHPAVPKPAGGAKSALAMLKSVAAGVTFEHQGLRAKVAIERKSR